MQTKLTLRLDDSVIEQAKLYAKQHGLSLSQMVSDYFSLLKPTKETLVSPPITRSLTGLLENSGLDENSYREYQAEKHH